jgi:hypothetical protein
MIKGVFSYLKNLEFSQECKDKKKDYKTTRLQDYKFFLIQEIQNLKTSEELWLLSFEL